MSSAQFCPVAKLDRLLLATDRSVFSEGAVREAINFAQKCKSRIFAMTVLERNPEYETIGASVYQKEEEETIKYLESVKQRAVQAGLTDCEAELHLGEEPYKLIVDEAREKKADMIVIGRRGRSGLMQVLMGKVAAKVIGHAPFKVLVGPKAARIEFRHVLVAVDGSDHSIAAAAEAVEIAKRCGSTIIAISTKHSEEETAEAEALVDRVAAMAKNEGVPVETMAPFGRSHEIIIETAGGRAIDLIVMGAYGKTGLKKLLMGSSTEKVIGRASCAVLVVRAQ